MPKKIMPGHPIFVAHKMLGQYSNGKTVVLDMENSNRILDPSNLDDKIIIYERQVKGWFLEPARLMLMGLGEKASFVVLATCFSHLEGIEQCRQVLSSEYRSKQVFKSSFRRVFSDLLLDDNQLNTLYYQGRCGLFHDGMTRSDVIYDMDLTTAFSVVNNGDLDRIYFHPFYLLESIEQDFDQYISELKSKQDNELRKNFHDRYKIV
jgi:hypothetical protein